MIVSTGFVPFVALRTYIVCVVCVTVSTDFVPFVALRNYSAKPHIDHNGTGMAFDWRSPALDCHKYDSDATSLFAVYVGVTASSGLDPAETLCSYIPAFGFGYRFESAMGWNSLARCCLNLCRVGIELPVQMFCVTASTGFGRATNHRPILGKLCFHMSIVSSSGWCYPSLLCQK